MALHQDAQLLLHLTSSFLAVEFYEELIGGNCEVMGFVDFADNREVMGFEVDIGVGDSKGNRKLVGDKVEVTEMGMDLVVNELVALREVILVEIALDVSGVAECEVDDVLKCDVLMYIVEGE